MTGPHRRCFLSALLAASLLATLAGRGLAQDAAALKAQFADPPRQYASAPLWVWNDLLTDEQIKGTLADLASQGVKQAFVHPRPGLATPYLSDEWFRLWKVALAEAERLDMNIWIYDENSYPSGFAGGLVPEAMPESRGRGLHVSETKQPGKLGEDVFAVFRLTADGYKNVTREARAGTLPDDRYLVFSWRLAPVGGWFGGKYYVDLLKPGVTEKFIEITHQAYKRELGEHFGKRLPGIFTDEPHLCPAGGLHWNQHLAEEFQKRWNYRLEDHLPSLVRPLGDWKRVRHNYQQLLLEQFIEHWGKPCHDFCEENNLEFTGHYWEHGWPGAGHGPDNMAMYAWHQRPAIDTLMNQYSEDVHAQFGNLRAVKELASVANQLGRKRTLCEAYGAGGWDLRFEDMKRIGDWLYVLGVNTLDEHLSYITIRGARKRDHPQSFSYHEPWWDSYHVMAKYFTRLSLAMSSGNEINSILILEPTTTAWMYQGDGHLNEIGNTFQKLITDLAKDQVEFDLGCEDILARHGSVQRWGVLGEKGEKIGETASWLRVGRRDYSVIVLPPHTENLNKRTIELLEELVQGEGKVICCGPPPSLVDGSPSDRATKLAASPKWRRCEVADLPEMLFGLCEGDPRVRRAEGDRGILFHHLRHVQNADLLLLVNTSIDAPSSGVVEAPVSKGIEQWDPATGEAGPYPFQKTGKGLEAAFELPPCGSLLLYLSQKPVEPGVREKAVVSTVPPAGPVEVHRLEPNVLTIDYVDITAGDEHRANLYFYEANQLAFRENGMERNPWDSAVQLHDQLITKAFPADSGFKATYHFTIEGRVPDELWVVIERPDLYTIACNGTKIEAQEGQWWLDKAFGKIDIRSAARIGANAVTIEARPFTIWHELEPAYVLGSFNLKATQSGFVIVPEQKLDIDQRGAHSTVPDGTMWLSAGIGFGTPQGGQSRDDGDPFVVFDLGRPVALREIKVWNYNEANLTGRGVKQLEIAASATGEPGSFDQSLGTFTLDEAASGSVGPSTDPRFPQTLPVEADGVRFVRFDVLSNHNGVDFPTTKGDKDNAFVGLSEVQFFTAAEGHARPQRVTDVKIHAVSSELTGNFNRRAAYLVDSSGLDQVGWNQQGHPFYGAGVAYTRSYDVGTPEGRYFVRLPSWYGSVAKVLVNGEPAGRIAWQPWQCEVTDHVKPGKNTVEVVVIGTLKNTLGPHHAGQMRGAAWPSAFHQGPKTGPPPGDRYDTIPYGLFAPFTLERTQ